MSIDQNPSIFWIQPRNEACHTLVNSVKFQDVDKFPRIGTRFLGELGFKVPAGLLLRLYDDDLFDGFRILGHRTATITVATFREDYDPLTNFIVSNAELVRQIIQIK